MRFFVRLYLILMMVFFNSMNISAYYLLISVSRISDISRSLVIIKKKDKNAKGAGIFSYSEYAATKEELEFFDKINSKVILSSDPIYKKILKLSNVILNSNSSMDDIYEEYAGKDSDSLENEDEYSKHYDKKKYASNKIKEILHNLVK